MNDIIQKYSILFNNPFVFGDVFFSFYKSLEEKENSILLAYLVLPLTLYPESQKYLTQKSNPSSCMRILVSEHARMYGLQERISEYRELTNITVQHLINLGVFSINEKMSVIIHSEWSSSYKFLNNANKAAQRLGKFMSPHDIPTSYRMLGVKKI